MAQKIIFIIFGALMLIGGIYCIAAPGVTYLVIAPLAGAGMIVDAVATFILWNNLRKVGAGSTLLLIGSIAAAILGIGLLASFGMQFAYDLFVAYMVAAWLVITGITRIVSAFKSEKKILILIIGILMVLCGVMGFANPISIMLALGLMIGISIVVSGINILSFAFVL